jgi:hypothetical protein
VFELKDLLAGLITWLVCGGLILAALGAYEKGGCD